MARPLVVWGGTEFYTSSGQRRFIVAATTKTRAVELMSEVLKYGFTIGKLNKYWSKTGNEVELSVATEEGVWLNTDTLKRPVREYYVRMKPRKEG